MKPIKLIIKTNSEKYPIFIGKNLITKISKESTIKINYKYLNTYFCLNKMSKVNIYLNSYSIFVVVETI